MKHKYHSELMSCDKVSIILKRNTEQIKLNYKRKIKTLRYRIGSRVKLLQKP